MIKVLWIDLVDGLDEAQVLRLHGAGISPVAVFAMEDLASLRSNADAVVLRLGDDTRWLSDARAQMSEILLDLPIICRVDRMRLETGVQAMQEGAAHVLPADEWTGAAWSVVQRLVQKPMPQQEFVFVDPVSRSLLELARRVAKADVAALLTGPTGAGKEVLARVLHDASPRCNGPFVALNCAAMPENLIEDLLFGHEKGAFTGALREHMGVFEQAQGGTLFLDEIAEMPYGLQSRLLRVLQERQITRLGARRQIPVDFRLIAATNKDLRLAMQTREFREDLYFRIATFRLRIPALAERRMDILPLARYMLKSHDRTGRVWQLNEDAESLLVEYSWPGNVRELSNVMQRALVLASGSIITPDHLIFEEGGDFAEVTPSWTLAEERPRAANMPVADEVPAGNAGLDSAIRASEHRAISAALRTSANRIDAAKALGISPRTLRYKLAQLRSCGYPIANARQG